jgi:CBS domain-containing protein
MSVGRWSFVQISDVLRVKGSEVRTIAPDARVRDLLKRLAEFEIGALVVVDNGVGNDAGLAGIVSERDVVRGLNDRGAALLDVKVADLMTPEVVTCSPDDHVDKIAEVMTERRIRHMPVVRNGELAGLVSIGDVVKSRIRQLEQDRGQLEHYITG